MKAIGLTKLNLITFIILLLKYRGNRKIYFLNISFPFLNKKFIKRIEKMNFFWCDFNNINVKFYFSEHQRKNNIYLYRKCLNSSKKIWHYSLKKWFYDKNLLALLIFEKYYKLHDDISLIKIYALNNGYKIESYYSGDGYFYLTEFKKIFPKIKIIKINSIIKFIIGCLNLLLNIFKFILRDNKIDRKNKNFNSLNNSQEIAFYSCNSFIYNDDITKDFIYSKTNPKFKKENFLNIDRKKTLNKKILNYYKKNKINFIKLDKHIDLENLFEFKNFVNDPKIKIKIFYKLFFLKNLYVIFNYKKILVKYKKLKLAIFSYDRLASASEIISAKLNNLKTLSFQTRVKFIYLNFPVNYDFYLTTSYHLKKELLKNKFNFSEVLVCENIKNRSYKQKNNTNPLKKYFKNENKICLILDCLSELDWYKDGLEIINNKKNHIFFLKRILYLVTNYPNINFIIKNKYLNYYKIQKNYQFERIYKQIYKQNNIIFSNSIKNSNSDNLLFNSDIIFSQYSSGIDEALNLDKLVIGYNINQQFNFMNKKVFFKEIIVNNENELYKKFKILNTNKFKKKISKMKKKYFGQKNQNLENILNNLLIKNDN